MIILFLFAAIFCFTVPGIFLLNKSKIQFNFWEKIILGTTLGFSFFTLLSYLLLVMKLGFLLLPIIIVIILISFKQILSLKRGFSLLPKRKLALFVFVFLFGVIGQMAIIAPSGIYQNGDLIFWSSHGHDGSWHISLMEEYKKGYPLQNPIFSGERLVNYHFFSDIAPAEFNKYFKIPALDLYFRFFPLMFSILLGSLSFILGARLGGFWTGVWAAIFTYFAGSFGYIVTFIQSKTVGGESLFWASQIQSSIGNPPQVISSILILAFLIFFLRFSKEGKGFLICALLAGTLIMFKAYGGIVILLSLFVVASWQILKEKRVEFLKLFILALAVSVIIYLPNTSKVTGFLIFEPWWFIRTMVVAPDRLNWLDLELKRQTYIFENNWKRVVQVELTAFVIFFFGNLGMRFLGLWHLVSILKSSFVNYFNLLFISIIFISFILPLLFLQKGVATNTIQFLQYFLLLFGILAGLTVSTIFKKVKLTIAKLLISLVILILTIPTQLALILSFYNRPPLAKIQAQELEGLSFLKTNTKPDALILTPPYNKYLDLKDRIPNIWDWSDSAYVAAFSTRRVYLADTEQIDIMGYDFKGRWEFQKYIFLEENPINFTKPLKENGIDYLYFPAPLAPKVDLSKTELKRVFSNSSVEIWKIP